MMAVFTAVLHFKPRFVLLFVACFTFLFATTHVLTTSAQDVSQVYQTTSSDGTAIQFNYPENWIVTDGTTYGVLYNTVIANDPGRIYEGMNEDLTGDQTQISLKIVSLEAESELFSRKYDFELFTSPYQVPWISWNPQTPLEPVSQLDFKGKRATLQVYLQQSMMDKGDITTVNFVGELNSDKIVFVVASTTPDHVEDTKVLVQAIANSVQYGDGEPEPEPQPTVIPRRILASGIPDDVTLAPINAVNASELQEITELPYFVNPDKMILVNDAQHYILIQGQAKSDREVVLDTATAHFSRYLTLEGDDSNSLRMIDAISPDGTLVASVGQVPADMGVYDAVSGARISQPEGLTIASAAAFSPDGQTIAFIGLNDESGSDRVLGLYDVMTGEKQGSILIDGTYDLSYTFMAFSPDRQYLFVPGGQILDVDTMSLRGLQTDRGRYQTESVDFNPVDENLILTTGQDTDFHVWDIVGGGEKASVTQGRGDTPQFVTNMDAIYTPDGALMITAAKTNGFAENELAIWDARTLERVATIEFPEATVADSIDHLAINPEGTFILFVLGNKVYVYGVPF